MPVRRCAVPPVRTGAARPDGGVRPRPRSRRLARRVPSPRVTASCRRHHDKLISMQGLNMTDVVIVSAARTAVGKFGGSLAKIAAPELGATVIRAVLERAG
ncbi:acetyl-CoA C-acetyltransferase, partial [Burkholderia orbicola]|nr:acetyl-CoA C-acetyltransferase [Burkholderia orbicola]MDN7505393.1 acetyl-CoA C-acetyltransferase [Burkholderia orbicola]